MTANFNEAADAGFDYVELTVKPIAAASDADFAKLAETLKRSKIEARSANQLLPGNLKVVGPDVDKAAQEDYIAKSFGRLHQLGVKVVVFGSGAARQIPENFPKEQALKQVIDFCKRIAPVARANELMVVIEPLNSKDCNFITTVREGLDIVEAINDPNIELLVDIYHMAMENEAPDIILKAGKHLRHVHVANPKGRTYPLPTDEFDYKPFFENLKKIGYSGGVTIEAGTKDFKTDGPNALAFLKEMLADSKAPPLR